MADRALNYRQQLFVEYFIGEARGNGVAAARMAGYSGNGDALHVTAYRLLRNATIAMRIRERVAAVAKDTDALLAETWRVASAPMSQFMVVNRAATYDEDGTLLEPAQLRLDYSSKIAALALLMRACGMLGREVPAEPVVKALIGIDVSRI